jgi:hypothetical protein
LAWHTQLRDNLVAVRHQHDLALTDQIQIPAEVVLQYFDANGPHGRVVATVAASVNARRLSLGSRWTRAQRIAFWGNPNTASLPASRSGAVDTDADSVYGIPLPTHLFAGAINIHALGGLTFNISTANTVLVDANTISGTTAFPTTGYIFGSDAGAIQEI